MGTTKLKVYNDALRIMKERRLATVSDAIEARYALDESYDDAVALCLEGGQWQFAARSVALEDTADVDPQFGFTYVFERPEDYVTLMGISSSGAILDNPMDGSEFLEEGNYFHANVDPLYIQYVSNGASYGLDLSLWPQSFAKAVAACLAMEIGPRLTSASDADIKRWNDGYMTAMRNARSKDAVKQGSRRLPPGRLTRARVGNDTRGYLGRIA